jgi:predicted ester cyclase
MRVIANRQITGEYGSKVAGDVFEVRDELAEDLLRRELVRRADPPRIIYQTKIIVPEAPEVSARPPFRDVSMPDQKPQGMATQGDTVLSGSNISPQGTSDPRGRRRRERFGSGR